MYSISLVCPPEEFAKQYNEQKTDSACFLTTGQNRELSFEQTHNMMHNYNGFSMNNNDFSVLNPLFYVYHSFIDYMLELKIRMIQEDYEFSKASLNLTTDPANKSNSVEKAVASLNSFFNQIMEPQYMTDRQSNNFYNEGKNIFMEKLVDFYENGDGAEFGNYQAMDWSNNNFDTGDTSGLTESDMSLVGFTYKKLMMNGSNLRSTTNLESLYKT